MRRSLTIALIALAISAAACSKDAKTGSTDKGSTGSVVLLAAEKTIKAGSSKVVMSAEFSAEGQTFSMTGEGAFNFKDQAGAMTFKLTGDEIPEAFSGFEIRFLSSTIYMKFPKEFSQVAPGLKTWLKADLEELSKQTGFNLPGINSFAGQDPTSALNFTRAAKDIVEVGPASVRGAPTTRYTMTIDLKKAIEAFPEEARGGMNELFAKADLKELPMELWVDGSGRARRLRFALDLSKFAEAAGAPQLGQGSATISMELFDFGTPVRVTAPPPADTSNFSDLPGFGGR